MVLRFNVGGKVVETVDLIRKKKWPWRSDIFPFAILYAIWMVTIVTSIDIVDALIVLGGLVSTHVQALLFTALFKCFVQYSKVSSITSKAIQTRNHMLDGNGDEAQQDQEDESKLSMLSQSLMVIMTSSSVAYFNDETSHKSENLHC